ncbi:hypothetical protein PILCRDRAFT_311029 [Piloderma croceum F 1598]|uniref:Uncharacterized protein n=1 Tax=Piloderma croceum (strain F 1598) TaxID=765440 RepID=A0A0C3G4C9_PILCF|nr:hypothetical protein PILCRDRAFT_311029 [Piloderma croceum F 1598]
MELRCKVQTEKIARLESRTHRRINIPIDMFLSRCADKTCTETGYRRRQWVGTGNITAKLSQLIDVENSAEGTLVGEQEINQAHRTVFSGQLAELR